MGDQTLIFQRKMRSSKFVNEFMAISFIQYLLMILSENPNLNKIRFKTLVNFKFKFLIYFISQFISYIFPLYKKIKRRKIQILRNSKKKLAVLFSLVNLIVFNRQLIANKKFNIRIPFSFQHRKKVQNRTQVCNVEI